MFDYEIHQALQEDFPGVTWLKTRMVSLRQHYLDQVRGV
jgi:hypothetical protein